MGDYLGQHFVCAYQQLGDFQVTNVNGKIEKKGGNVVSYFLTPDGLVVDAVVGPVAADKLLDAAKFSVDTWQQASQNKWLPGQASVVSQAHQMLSRDPIHRYLAERPLAPFPMVSDHFFHELGGEKPSTDRTAVAMAADEYIKARRAGRPVLLVLDRVNAADHDETALARRVRVTLTARPAVGPARRCQIVYLPIDQLAALSSLIDTPQYELADANLPTMVLCRSTGEQIVAMPGDASGKEVAAHLLDALRQERAAQIAKRATKAKAQLARKP